MVSLLFRKGLSALAVAATLFAIAPGSVFAAIQSVPGDLTLIGGIYTNDTTPTATWTRPTGATWYQFMLDNGGWQNISNVDSYTLWPLASGWHAFTLRAHNNAGGVSASVSVTFEIDIQGPSVSMVSPSSAIEDESVTLAVTTSGESEATFCDLYVDGNAMGDMTKYSNSSFKKVFTFHDNGSFSVHSRCTDGDGNYTTGPLRTITVSTENNVEPENDETFLVNDVTPTSATEDELTTMRVTTSGTLDAKTCKLYVNGSSVGTMSESSSNSFSKSYAFSNDGSYTVYAFCKDENGDWTKGSSRTVTVDDEDDEDNDNTLDVPSVSPSTAQEDERTEFTVRPTSDYNITDCWLYVDGSRVATMSEKSRNVFTAKHTFNRNGSYNVYVYCKDSSGDTATGDKRTVRVSDDENDTNNDAEEGSLIKTACTAKAGTNDPCKAVYYYGKDGKRHVFPNEATYFTWYSDFDDVVEVSSDFMSSLTIGKNVTFRPGSVLVKFETSSNIYAVKKDHTLRRYTKTSLIKSDYGGDYEDVIVTISDSLYGNYTIGSVIDSTSDFDRDDEYYSVDSIDDVL